MNTDTTTCRISHIKIELEPWCELNAPFMQLRISVVVNGEKLMTTVEPVRPNDIASVFDQIIDRGVRRLKEMIAKECSKERG